MFQLPVLFRTLLFRRLQTDDHLLHAHHFIPKPGNDHWKVVES